MRKTRDAEGNWITDSDFVPVVNLVVTEQDVDFERDRRIAEFAYEIDGVEYMFQMDDKSQQLLTAAGALAKFAIFAGALPGNLRWADADNDFVWWDKNNMQHPLDAYGMSAFADAVMKYVTDIRRFARNLKDQNPIPADYAEQNWP
jgi:hypothetical protein